MLIPLTESPPDPRRVLRLLSIVGFMFLGVGATATVEVGPATDNGVYQAQSVFKGLSAGAPAKDVLDLLA
jgi:hypothetical protein